MEDEQRRLEAEAPETDEACDYWTTRHAAHYASNASCQTTHPGYGGGMALDTLAVTGGTYKVGGGDNHMHDHDVDRTTQTTVGRQTQGAYEGDIVRTDVTWTRLWDATSTIRGDLSEAAIITKLKLNVDGKHTGARGRCAGADRGRVAQRTSCRASATEEEQLRQEANVIATKALNQHRHSLHDCAAPSMTADD